MELAIPVAEVFVPLLVPKRYKGAWGGRACVHPDTQIDTPNGVVRIGDFYGGVVRSFDGEKIIDAYAGPVRFYPETELFEITLSNGSVISCTKDHRWLTPSGWRSNLQPYEVVFSLGAQDLRESSLDISPSGSLAGVQHCLRTLLGFLWCYSRGFRLYGEQPPPEVKTYQDVLQQLAGAQRHSPHVSSEMDAMDNAYRRIHSQLSLHLSSLASHLHAVAQSSEASETCISDISSVLLSESFQLSQLSRSKKILGERVQELAELLLLFGYSIRPAENLQTISDILLSDVDDNSFSNSISCNLDHRSLTERVVSVKSVGMHKYCYIFVPIYNNYIVGGTVHHNSAKSHFFADQVIRCSMQEKCDIICLRETQLSLQQSVKKLIEIKIEAFGLGKYFNVLQTHIETKKGGRIGFQGMQNHTADSIKSLQGYKYAWVEEAQNFSQRSLDLLRPTIREDNSEIWFSWNPNQATDPVDVFLRENPPQDAIVVKANYVDNPWLPKVMLDEIEYDKRRDPDKYAHVWLGQYQQNSEARVFKNWKVEDFERPEGTIHRLGADWGFSIDPSCLIRCDLDGSRLYVDYEAYMVGCEIDRLPDLFDRVPESRKWFITADSARPETISYMRKHGYPRINAAVKGKKSVEEGVAFLQSFDIVVHPRCKHLIDELTLYSYKTDSLTGVVLPILEDKRNHLIDSLRYACEGARRVMKKRDEEVKRVETHYGAQAWMMS